MFGPGASGLVFESLKIWGSVLSSCLEKTKKRSWVVPAHCRAGRQGGLWPGPHLPQRVLCPKSDNITDLKNPAKDLCSTHLVGIRPNLEGMDTGRGGEATILHA